MCNSNHLRLVDYFQILFLFRYAKIRGRCITGAPGSLIYILFTSCYLLPARLFLEAFLYFSEDPPSVFMIFQISSSFSRIKAMAAYKTISNVQPSLQTSVR